MSGCKTCGSPSEGEFCSKSCEMMYKNFHMRKMEVSKSDRPIVRTRNINTTKNLNRKVVSEKALEDNIDWHLNIGDCWHCFSFGDVDALSYIRHIVREQHVYYLAISTFSMASADIHEINEWLERGLVDRVDFYVSENFLGTYKAELELCVEIASKHNGRAAVFKNHSKVSILYGDKYCACIESSANMNTNPRCENTTITIDKSVCDFYKEIFDGISPFNKKQQPERWKKWAKRRKKSAKE